MLKHSTKTSRKFGSRLFCNHYLLLSNDERKLAEKYTYFLLTGTLFLFFVFNSKNKSAKILSNVVASFTLSCYAKNAQQIPNSLPNC